MPNLSSPIGLIAGLLVLIVIVIIVGSLLGAKNKKAVGLTDVIGQAQEITRVTTTEVTGLRDPSVAALGATALNTLTSDQVQFKKYATDHKLKINTKELDGFKNSSTDDTLAKAAAANNLDVAYVTYLDQALKGYRDSLKSAFDGTNDAGLKSLLSQSYQSSGELLQAPALSSSN